MNDLRSSEVTLSNGGTGYRFNADGNQVAYKCDVRRVTTIHYDRNVIRRELQELKNPPDLAHARIYDRLLEMCTPIKINGQNIRQLRAQENMKQMREKLTS